ncbi:MAG: NUDIX hydrolase [Spirulinaceae cyanobacterium]
MANDEPQNLRDRFVEIRSPWLTLIGEHIEGDRGQVLDYWRVEKADSAVIITLQGDRLILPKPAYRPGLAATTLDFPGGRIPHEETPLTIAPKILQRELGISSTAIHHLEQLNETGWAINSSFSNQKLYGLVAIIDPGFAIPIGLIGKTYDLTKTGLQNLKEDLTCLQCRAVFLEWRDRVF